MPLVVIRSETLKRGGGDKILEIEKQKESVSSLYVFPLFSIHLAIYY